MFKKSSVVCPCDMSKSGFVPFHCGVGINVSKLLPGSDL